MTSCCRPRTATPSPTTPSARRAPRRAPLGTAVIADDSGIEAAALGGAPGVRSARFAGEDATDEQNLARLLREAPAGSAPGLRVRDRARRSRARRRSASSRAAAPARCAARPRGSGGFGYDPAFVPDDLADGRTMAELTPAEKDAISHRGRAARALLDALSGG